MTFTVYSTDDQTDRRDRHGAEGEGFTLEIPYGQRYIGAIIQGAR